MPRSRKAQKFVGFARVSSDRQGEEGLSIRSQKLSMEQYVAEVGGSLEIPYTSVEKGHGTATERGNFFLTIKHARERNLPILVTSADRLSRSVDDLKFINLRATPVHVVGQGKLSKKDLYDQVAAAARDLVRLSKDAKASHAKRVPKPLDPLRAVERKQRSKAGFLANQDRAFRRGLVIEEFLRTHPGSDELSVPALAKELNDAGILNCPSEKKGVHKPWTVPALRHVLKAVRDPDFNLSNVDSVVFVTEE
jgi:hypothetical protein